MALREFSAAGRDWLVWDVVPQVYRGPDRRDASRRDPGAPEYTGPERRGPADRRLTLVAGLERGWLCFESGSEKRRLAPIPLGWEDLPDAELERLLGQAGTMLRRVAALEPDPNELS